jgi:hypothetical protein
LSQVIAEPARTAQGFRFNGGVAMTVDEELERLDEPEILPQEIVQWQPGRGRVVNTPKALNSSAIGAAVVGAVALGAVALGAVAIGRLAIGSLALGRGRIKRLEIDKLIVHHVVAPER